jgi:nucleoid DNA-binding protein
MITKEGIPIKEVCIELAAKYNLPVNTIRDIVSSQFKVLKENIKEGNEVEILHIGKFLKAQKKFKNE